MRDEKITEFHPLPQVVSTVSGRALDRTHVTFTNLGPNSALSVVVDTIRRDGHTIDFEMIDELRPGASLTCLSIVYPVVGNDPHWAFDFRAGPEGSFAVPFVVRYNDVRGRFIVVRNILKWDGQQVLLRPDKPPELEDT